MMVALASATAFTSCDEKTSLPPYDSPWVDPVGTGTVDDPFNCSAAVNKCKEVGQTASQNSYFVTGYVVGGECIAPSYGNATFTMADAADGQAIFTAFHIRGIDNAKFTDADADLVKVGDVITIYAPLVNFRGTTPETNGGYLYAINGEVVSTPIIPDHGQFPAVAEGDGTEAKPYNCAQIVKVCEETGTTATSQSYYISGYVVGGDGIDTSYGNATFKLADSYMGPGIFTAYRIYDVNGDKFTDAEKIKIGDFITVYGKVVNYSGNTPETTQGAQLVSFKPAASF